MTVNCNNLRSSDLARMLKKERIPTSAVQVGDVVMDALNNHNEVARVEEHEGRLVFFDTDYNSCGGGSPDGTTVIIPRDFFRHG